MVFTYSFYQFLHIRKEKTGQNQFLVPASSLNIRKPTNWIEPDQIHPESDPSMRIRKPQNWIKPVFIVSDPYVSENHITR
jgi:hypothetical protein